MAKNWPHLTSEKTFARLKSNKKGLNKEEIELRQKQYGENALETQKKVPTWKLFLHQFTDFLSLILIAAAVISYLAHLFLNEPGANLDTFLILIILLANGIFGFIQNYKAEKSMDELRHLSTTLATVLRGSKRVEINAQELVPGDVIFLEEGSIVPADARMVDSINLRVDESNLTGESVSVAKEADVLTGEKIPISCSNMLYMSTAVVSGRGSAVVTEIGMQTQVGYIAQTLKATEDRPTPFQNELNRLGKRIGALVLGLALVMILVEWIAEGFMLSSLLPVFVFGVSLAVAAVPEGLPAVVTVGLAVGSRRMVKKKALVRHLAVVESLGSVDVICTDKTGTLTESLMTVQRLYVEGEEIEVTGRGYNTAGEFLGSDKVEDQGLELLLKTGALCNNADFESEDNYSGDPTELALKVSAVKKGMGHQTLRAFKRLSEEPFSSERKMMSVVCKDAGKKNLFAKGAPEKILEKCHFVWKNGKKEKLTPEKRKQILSANEKFTGQAYRVLGFAFCDEACEEKKLTFVGLQAMMDPPRKEVSQALKDCKQAGIRVVMITGDHPNTALAIAKELDLPSEAAVTGEQLNNMTTQEIQEKLKTVSVFARVNPEHKVKILKALQKDHLVAMTGDGVNDAPALKQADIGIAMGIRGTDVAKQAADMVLLDDNFATIRSAIREGRGIFGNIRKFVHYLLSANAGEVLLIFGALIYGWVQGSAELMLPLTAIHLLWINLLTDGFPALALAMDPIPEGVMNRPPKKHGEGVINRPIAFSIASMGIVLAFIGLMMFVLNLENFARAQTLTFTTLVILELIRIGNVRRWYNIPPFSNHWVIGAILISLTLQLLVIYTPLATYFRVVPLSLLDWMWIAGAAVVFLVLSKLLHFGQKKRLGSTHFT